MSTVNKQSYRALCSGLKAQFAQLVAEEQVSPACMNLLLAFKEALALSEALFLEKTTKKTSKNSSKPPSQTGKDNSSLDAKGSKGKGKPEDDQMSANTRTTKKVTHIRVYTCDQCGASLKDTPCTCVEQFVKIDIFYEKVVEHFNREIKDCPKCHAQVKGKLPDDIKGPLQYGPGVKSLVISLLIGQMVPLKRAQGMLKTLLGNTISESTMLNYVMRLHEALEPWEQDAKAALLKQKCINTDETSMRVDKKNRWVHVYSSGHTTLKFLHHRRGIEAIEDINIIPRYGGVVVHDCWAAYFSYGQCSHGLCGSHLLRELTFVIDSNDYRWARNMKKLLQETCGYINRSENKRLSKKRYATLQRRYRNILTRGGAEMPAVIENTTGSRRRAAKSDAHNLLERLRKYEEAVLLFARKSYVAFTNNRAERDLRPAKVKQKISGCFREEKYAHVYCRISSYLQTAANKGINPLVAIQMALDGKPLPVMGGE